MAKKDLQVVISEMEQDIWDCKVKHSALMFMVCVMIFLAGWFMGRLHFRESIRYNDTVMLGGEMHRVTEIK